VLRTIDRFTQDEHGTWVAALSCLHRQHVRHQPPFRDRPWVLTEQGRAEHLGTALDCPLCDRAELPRDLEVVRTAGPFDATTLPAGLRRSHRVAERTWGHLRVLDGSVRFTMDTTPPVDARLNAGDAHAIPPGVTHAVSLDGSARIAVDFLTAPA
jgi:tellurite methyltransferase